MIPLPPYTSPLFYVDTTSLLGEAEIAEQFGTNHYHDNPERADWPLRHCKSIWLKSDNSEFHRDFPNTRMFLQHMLQRLEVESQRLGRVYYTSLPSGLAIEPHSDKSPYFSTITRFQLYFDLDIGHTLLQVGSTIQSNYIHVFRHGLTHAYVNNSCQPLTFLVFDVYN